jgi:hypothetical protein
MNSYKFKGCIDLFNAERLRGWVAGPNGEDNLKVHLFIRGEKIQVIDANTKRLDVIEACGLKGNYGFDADLSSLDIKPASKEDFSFVAECNGLYFNIPFHFTQAESNYSKNILKNFDIKGNFFKKKLLLYQPSVDLVNDIFSNGLPKVTCIGLSEINIQLFKETLNKDNFMLLNFINNIYEVENNYFDFIYLLKYDPLCMDRNFIHMLSKSLSVNGKLLLEARFNQSEHRSFNLDLSSMDFIPSFSLLRNAFSEFVFRIIGASNFNGYVRCLLTPKRPVVTLIGGDSGTGKTSRTLLEADGGAIVISIDQIFSVIDFKFNTDSLEDDYLHNIVDKFFQYRISQGKSKGLLGDQNSFVKFILVNNYADFICRFILRSITESFDRYVIEGGILTNADLCSHIVEVLNERGFKVWILTST